jgi:hypothetical protein
MLSRKHIACVVFNNLYGVPRAVDLTVKALHTILRIGFCRLFLFTVPFDYIDKARFETKFTAIAQFSVENDLVHDHRLLINL